MSSQPGAISVRVMSGLFPFVWLLLILPFVSSAVIANFRPLRELSAAHNQLMFVVGLSGLAAFIAGLVGLVPSSWALVAVLIGGALGGFSFFLQHGDGEDGSDDGRWGRWDPPPDDGPPAPDGGGIDWDLFDRLRARWETQPTARH
jgi:hypothetical protein